MFKAIAEAFREVTMPHYTVSISVSARGQTAQEAQKQEEYKENLVREMLRSKWNKTLGGGIWLGKFMITQKHHQDLPFECKRELRVSVREDKMGVILDDCVENGASLENK